MLIVDSQVHVWAAATRGRPWPLRDPDLPAPHKPQPVTAKMLLNEMNAAGVDQAVLVSPAFKGVRDDVY